MLYDYLLVFFRTIVGLVFAFSFVSKARNISLFVGTIRSFQLFPRSVVALAAKLFLAGELATAILMGAGGVFLGFGFVLAAALLSIFSVALGVSLRRKMNITCNCFGATEKRISYADIWRNSVLILCTLAGWVINSLGAGEHEQLSFALSSCVSLGAIVFVVGLLNLRYIAELFRLD